MTAAGLIAVQVMLLATMRSGPVFQRSHNVWIRYLGPLQIFSFFYLVYVLNPQVYGLLNDYFMLGFESTDPALRKSAFISAQVALCLFLVAVRIGAAITDSHKASDRELTGADPDPRPADDDPTPLQALLLVALLVVGLAAYIELGSQFRQIDGFRSQLVQSGRGRVLTAVAFSANFAMSILLARMFDKGQLVRAALLSAGYATAVLAVGSRGRILWPILIAIALHIRFDQRIKRSYAIAVVVVFPMLLLVMDQISAILRGTANSDGVTVDFTQLYTKRNFDGFANIAIVLDRSTLEPELSRLFTGAREDFMLDLFPALWNSGVGTGVSIAGWLYLSGGYIGMLVLATGYGASLGLIAKVHRRSSSAWTATTYLIAMSWYAAVAGNLVESLDKMVAGMLPGLLLILSSTSLFKTQNRNQAKVPEYVAVE